MWHVNSTDQLDAIEARHQPWEHKRRETGQEEGRQEGRRGRGGWGGEMGGGKTEVRWRHSTSPGSTSKEEAALKTS